MTPLADEAWGGKDVVLFMSLSSCRKKLLKRMEKSCLKNSLSTASETVTSLLSDCLTLSTIVPELDAVLIRKTKSIVLFCSCRKK